MPLQQTSGNSTTDAYAGGAAAVVPNYIEDVFSTYLLTETSQSMSVVNNIDLSGKGGMVWAKVRSGYVADHAIWDTVRGRSKSLIPDDTSAQTTSSAAQDLVSFNNNGFTLGAGYNTPYLNGTGANDVFWTFRKQPKFFDVVTYTGTGANTTIAHALGSVPGCIMVKRTDTTGNWQVYHNSLTSAAYSIQLNLTAAQASATTVWNSTAPTTSVFSVGTDATVNASGGTYVAYIFAHNAGGFGLAGTDNVISCGSFTTDVSGNATVNLGYEPQWVMFKYASGNADTGDWHMLDNMRGMPSYTFATPAPPELDANLSSAEGPNYAAWPTATGFRSVSGSTSTTYIYIAIRRGPMKVPTDATKVFAPLARNTNGTNTNITTTLPVVDMVMYGDRNGVLGDNAVVIDRLRGYTQYLRTSTNAIESPDSFAMKGFDVQTGYRIGTDTNGVGTNYNTGGPYPLVNWQFTRAPSFFDEVCYTGTGVARTVAHNLGVVPELMIVKERTIAGGWATYNQTSGNTAYLSLNLPNAVNSSITLWNNTSPTSTVFTVGTGASVNSSGNSLVAYLFATCPGVSKVGSYTGNGTTQTINCGFTAGARFVLIKRTDSTGDWYVYDTARGMTTLTDPYLLLNSTSAETATLGSVTTVTTGFALNEVILTGINTNAASYIYLSIA